MVRSVIVSAVRTPFGRLGGALAGHQATELGAVAIRAALDRAGVENHEVEYAVMGQVLQGGVGQAPARQATVGAGLPVELPSDTINKVCASSIRAVEIADQMIRAGDVQVVVAGGMESMSNAPYVLKQARFGYRLGDGTLIDLTLTEFQLLVTLARRPGRVFTRAQLLDAIRCTEVEAFDRAIDAHVKNIRRKLEPDTRNPRYVLTVYGVGYRVAES